MTDEQHHGPSEPDAETRSRWTLPPGTRRPVPNLVEEHIVELIANGELTVGDRLPTEPVLARHMAVARSSVRTALQRLQARRVLEVNRGRGWFVASEPHASTADTTPAWPAPGAADLLEVMEVRIALEGMAVALAATRCSTGDLDEIAKLSQEHRDARLDETSDLLRTDQEFHGAIVASARNEYLATVYASLTPLLAGWRANSFGSAEVHRRSAAEHDQIVWQLRRGDEMGARLAMTTHLLGQHAAIESEHVRRGDRVAAGPVPGLSTFIDDDSG